MNKNQAVILYGAGFRGARNFEALTAENIRVEAFCDRDAEYIQLYRGCEVYNVQEAVKLYGKMPFIISIDDKMANDAVAEILKEYDVEFYRDVASFYQGNNDMEVQTSACGKVASFNIVESLLKADQEQVCFSFGVGFDYTFEEELIEKYGLTVYAFDPTPEVMQNMCKQVLPDKLHYYPYGLSNEDGIKQFHKPKTGLDYSEYLAPWTAVDTISAEMHRLKTLMDQFGYNHLDILKMDIEGSEFLALPEILESGVKFDQLCIEIHSRIFPDSVHKTRELKNLLNKHGYLMVENGIHEQTYVHKSVSDKI